MDDIAGLREELARSEIARDAMAMLEAALARRSEEEKGAFWRAVDLYYFSRKAPPEPVPAASDVFEVTPVASRA